MTEPLIEFAARGAPKVIAEFLGMGTKAAEGVEDTAKVAEGVSAAEKTAEGVSAAEKTAVEAGEGGKEALADAAKKGAAKGKSLFSDGIGFVKKHPKSSAVGALGLGLLAAGAMGGGDGGGPIKSLSDALGAAGIPNGTDVAGNGKSFGAGHGGTGEIEIDTEALGAFAVELRRAADALHTAPGEMKAAIAELTKHYSTDGAGTPTRDGGVMPCASGMTKSLAALDHQYEQVVQGIITQLTHDADAIDAICRAHEDSEREHSEKFNNIDTGALA
ncbi:hypothetical protein [Mycobacterium servetii]|uniref:Uncharacterized protein n=1 Tax=Mycobacterium servetii TaxID=3237418 RepID=A0ABV4BZS9_9MYCO